jgi:hypothetical protein
MNADQIVDRIIEESTAQSAGTDADLRKAILLTKAAVRQIIEETTFGHENAKLKHALKERIEAQI